MRWSAFPVTTLLQLGENDMTRKRLPKYSLHKGTGQARVIVEGRHIYLGKYGSDESRARYQQVIDSLAKSDDALGGRRVTVGQLSLLYMAHASEYYATGGRNTMVGSIRSALKELVRLFRSLDAALFSPKKLKLVRDAWVEKGLARSTCNKYAWMIVAMFDWGVAEELVRPEIVMALRALRGLRAGRSAARETAPVRPVPDSDVESVKEFLNPIFWDAVQFQLLTACRPGEALMARPVDVDMSGLVWVYRPSRHKTMHHGKGREILIGPNGQELLRQRMPMSTSGYFFGKDGQSRMFNRDSYTKAIRKACVKAGVSEWSPNQLRHSAATRIRKLSKVEIAKTILGHSDLKTTEIYAERDIDAAMAVVLRIG